MNYSFMTFSCPKASLEETINIALAAGYNGIEPRTAAGHLHGVEISANSLTRSQIRKQFEKASLAIPCIATSCAFTNPSKRDENIESAGAHVELANDLGCNKIRVFGGEMPAEITTKKAIQLVAESLKKVSLAAEKHSVVVCVETHDGWIDPILMAEVMLQVNHPLIAVNWDFMHPVRMGFASIMETYKILRPWIRHAHIHDIDKPGQWEDIKMVPIGSGIVDHRAVLELLLTHHSDIFLSGEWFWGYEDGHLSRELQTMKGYERQILADRHLTP